jgi:hypothetical protein
LTNQLGRQRELTAPDLPAQPEPGGGPDRVANARVNLVS